MSNQDAADEVATLSCGTAALRLVHDVLQEQGEHLAAGAAIAPLTSSEEALIGAFLVAAREALDLPSGSA